MAKNATEMIKKLKKPKEEDKFQIAKDGLTLLKQVCKLEIGILHWWCSLLQLIN